MGCCMSNESGNSNNNSNGQNRQPPQQQQRAPQNRPRGSRPSQSQAAGGSGHAAPMPRIQYLQNQNVEKIIQGKSTGEGIKQTPSYETPLTKHKLEQWRQEFWETRTSGSQDIWNLLRNACIEDHATATAMIEAVGVQMPQNSLTTCIDQAGVYYRVPIACINDPVNYEQNYQLEQLKSKDKPPEQVIQGLKIKLMSDNQIIALDPSNLLSILELKQTFLEKLESDNLQMENLRFFCLGKELSDDLFLYSYDLKDEMTIQCAKRIIPKEE